MQKLNFRIQRLWWLFPLIAFDTLYFLLIQLLVLPPESRTLSQITLAWEAIAFMVFAGVVSIYTVVLIKNLLSKRRIGILSRYLQILAGSLLLFLVIVSITMFITEYLLGMKRDLNYVIGNALIFVFHHFIVSNVFIAYLYLKESGQLKQELLMAEKAKAELKLKVLQQQMSPHFLFNNLNTLISLVDPKDKEVLGFTKSLSSIYRYFTSSIGEDLVSLEKELEFIRHYFELIEYRFGPAYQLQLSGHKADHGKLLVVPMCLQLVVENAIKHNIGNRNKPLIISIKVNESSIKVSNLIREKKNQPTAEKSGTGLKNLDERCQLIMGKQVHYGSDGGIFTIQVPFISKVPYESIDH